MKLWEYLDDMDKVEKTQPTRASRRDHGFHFTRGGITCVSALILTLLSVALYLDRTLEQPIRWQSRVIDHQRGASLYFKAAATAAVVAVEAGSSSRPRISLREKSLGTSSRIAADVNKGELRTSRQPVLSRSRDGVTGGALLGMGVTFRKGSRAMSELMVAHLHDTTTPAEFRLFLRTLHRSGVTARADVVFLFPRGLPDDELTSVLYGEERSFWRIMLAQQATVPNHTRKNGKKSKQSNNSALTQANTSNTIFVIPNSSITAFKLAAPPSRRLNQAVAEGGDPKMLNHANSSSTENIYRASELPKISICPFNFRAFWQSREEGIQGKGRRLRDRVMWKTNKQYVHGSGSTDDEMTEAVKWGDWGSTAGFDMQDLERDEAITGFIDNPPSQLRRWMCYKMLLGMVKRHYQNVLLTEVRGVFILGDVMSATRDPSFGSSVYLFSEDRTWNEGSVARENFFKENRSSSSRDVDISKENRSSSSMDLEKLRDGDQVSTQVRRVGEPFRESSQNGSDGKRRQQLSFIYDVYGKEVWKKLEEEDKQRALLSSGIIMGNMKSVQTLSNAMLTEIVRVAAILKKSREPFHDQPLLNYLVQKSGILNRKVSENLSILSNGASSVHTLPGSKQKSLFVREEGALFYAMQGLRHELVPEEVVKVVIKSIHTDICSSQAELRVYEDCPLPPEHLKQFL